MILDLDTDEGRMHVVAHQVAAWRAATPYSQTIEVRVAGLPGLLYVKMTEENFRKYYELKMEQRNAT